MMGLLLKDFYMMKKYCRAFLLCAVIFLAVSVAEPDNFFFLVYPVILAGMIPVTLLSYDEREKWDRYSGVLPYTRAQIVSVKYLIGFAIIAVVSLAVILLQIFNGVRGGALHMEELRQKCVVFFTLGLLTPTVVLPFSFKWGTEKGRIAYYACIILVCAAGGFLGSGGLQLLELPHFEFSSLPILAIAILLYLFSWRLSIHFYEKREL